MKTTVPDVDIAATTATTPTLHRSVEDQGIEHYIRDAEHFLETARLHPDLSEKLAHYGFDDEELSRGMALQDAAWKAFCSRHGECPPERSGDIAELSGRMRAAREDFADFRLVARAAFPNLSDRASLRVVGDPPDDLQRFVTAAYAGYEAAGQAPYAEKLAKRAYPAAKLAKLREALDVLATMDAANAGAAVHAADEPDTGERDAAYIDLKQFMKELKGVTKAVFRKQPETLAMLGL